MTQALSRTPYSNWSMQGPDGKVLCRISDKRALWYINKGLADQLDSSNVIQLKFTPGGPGNANDPYLLSARQNHCAVCGAETELNMHHIVPYQYRKFMPEEIKGNNSYDVLPLCLDDHETYETEAQKHSIALAHQYGTPVTNNRQLTEDEHKLNKMLSCAKVVALHEQKSLPPERFEELKAAVIAHYGRVLTVNEVAQERKKFKQATRTGNLHAEELVRIVLERNELQQFFESWRRHFVETMKPRFLSELWTIEHVRPRDA